MHIEITGTVSVPIQTGPKKYEHTFYVLVEAASDCLLGLDFLEINKCDALFLENKLKIDTYTLVHFYSKQILFDEKQVYRVMALEKISIPPQHVMIVPGTILGWRVPQVVRFALFEPQDCFINSENRTTQDALLIFENGLVSITIATTKDEVLTIGKCKTLGLSQLVSRCLIQEVNRKKTKKYIKVHPKYDL